MVVVAKHRLRAVLLVAPAIICGWIILWSCERSGEWYPIGAAELLSFHEVGTETYRYCVVAYRIRNVGSTEIVSSTLSLAVETDRSTYYRTVVDERNILPGGSVTGTVEFEYYSPAERADTEGIALADSFFR